MNVKQLRSFDLGGIWCEECVFIYWSLLLIVDRINSEHNTRDNIKEICLFHVRLNRPVVLLWILWVLWCWIYDHRLTDRTAALSLSVGAESFLGIRAPMFFIRHIPSVKLRLWRDTVDWCIRPGLITGSWLNSGPAFLRSETWTEEAVNRPWRTTVST